MAESLVLKGTVISPTALASRPVADVVAGGVVVAAVYLLQTRPVQMHRDRGLLVGVADAVDAPVSGKYRGGPVLGPPGKVPGLFQSGVFVARSVVEPLVTLLEDGAQSAGVGPPAGVVVDLGARPGGPHEDLQREGPVVGIVAAGHVPIPSALRRPEVGEDLASNETGIPDQLGEEAGGPRQGRPRGEPGDLRQFVGVRCERGPHVLLPSFFGYG